MHLPDGDITLGEAVAGMGFACVEKGASVAEGARELARQRSAWLVVCDQRRALGAVPAWRLGAALAGGDCQPGSPVDDLLQRLPVLMVRMPLAMAIKGAAREMEGAFLLAESDGECRGLIDFAGLGVPLPALVAAASEESETQSRDRLQKLTEANHQLLDASLLDTLTQVGNRRAMEADLAYLYKVTQRYHRPASLLLMDVDHFKKYNDHYGHGAGDEVLRQVAATLRGAVREVDKVYRYGGEEFLVSLPETGLEGARVLARRLVQAVAGIGLLHEKSPYGVVTVSCGVAEMNPAAHSDWTVVAGAADEALYLAKERGRNQAVRSGDRSLVEPVEAAFI